MAEFYSTTSKEKSAEWYEKGLMIDSDRAIEGLEKLRFNKALLILGNYFIGKNNERAYKYFNVFMKKPITNQDYPLALKVFDMQFGKGFTPAIVDWCFANLNKECDLESLKKIVALGENIFVVQMELGNYFFKKEAMNKAAYWFRRAANTNPTNTESVYMLKTIGSL